MKSKTLLTFALFFAVSASIIAKDISLSNAEQIAINFFFEKSNQYDNAVDYYDLNIKESYLAENAYYVINLENGWVIVAANDALVCVIVVGVSTCKSGSSAACVLTFFSGE